MDSLYNCTNGAPTINLRKTRFIEAMDEMGNFLADYKYTSVPALNIITGRGSNSRDGRPVLKPTVKRFLKENEYTILYKAAGYFTVKNRYFEADDETSPSMLLPINERSSLCPATDEHNAMEDIPKRRRTRSRGTKRRAKSRPLEFPGDRSPPRAPLSPPPPSIIQERSCRPLRRRRKTLLLHQAHDAEDATIPTRTQSLGFGDMLRLSGFADLVV